MLCLRKIMYSCAGKPSNFLLPFLSFFLIIFFSFLLLPTHVYFRTRHTALYFIYMHMYTCIYICMTCVIAKDSNSRRNIHETWRLKSLHFSLFKIVKSNSLSFLFYVSLFVRQTMRARWNANWKNLLSAIP